MTADDASDAPTGTEDDETPADSTEGVGLAE